MSTIGGPGGIGGPKGPSGPDDADDLDGPDSASGSDSAGQSGPAGQTGQAGQAGQIDAAGRSSDIDAIAADLAAGRLTPHEAVDKLVDQIAGTEHLDAGDRAELRELMSDLIANDPHLAGIVGRLG